jgi:ATP-dependent Lon protease
MEILTLSGYTDEEKVRIAEQYLIGKQLAARPRPGRLSFEPGPFVRFEATRARLVCAASIGNRGGRAQVARGSPSKRTRFVTTDHVADHLGRPHFVDDVAERDATGVATGLAWTPVSGDVLFVEASMMRAARTGSSSPACWATSCGRRAAAVSYVWSNAEMLGIGQRRSRKTIHVRSGRGHSEGRAVRRRDDHDGAGLAGHATPGARAIWR